MNEQRYIENAVVMLVCLTDMCFALKVFYGEPKMFEG
jgi:hypothetical protein